MSSSESTATVTPQDALTHRRIGDIVSDLQKLIEEVRARDGIAPDASHAKPADGGPACKECDSKRFVLLTAENGYQSAHNCSCLQAIIANRRFDASGMAHMRKTHRFEDFTANTPWREDLFDKATLYMLDLMAGGNGWFAMLGQSGAGKTHLCTAICIELLNSAKEVLYIVWNDFVVTAKKRFDPEFGHANSQEVTRVQQAAYLYIDDLFKKAPSQADIDIAFEIINYRAAVRLPTIISSERSMNDLTKIDEATASRIYEMVCRNGHFVAIAPDSAKNFRKSEPDWYSLAQRKAMLPAGMGEDLDGGGRRV